MNQITDQPKIRICNGCGRLLAADAAECPYCGHRSEELVAAQQEAVLERTFLTALFTRSNPFTFLFIGINLGVFALMWLAGGMGAMSADHEVLIGFGAKENTLIDAQHQYWRFVTSIFIHIGFLHLFFNNYALWIVGQEIERIYGSSRFVIIYLATGVTGSVASYLFNPLATSAGASGAIFGLFGVLATFAFRYRKEIPNIISSDIRRRVIPLIVINLLFGFSIAQIDNSAHVGGLLMGVALGLAVPYKRPQEKVTARIWRTLLLASLCVIVFCFVTAFRNYGGPGPQLANLMKTPGSQVIDYFNRMNEARSSMAESYKSFVTVLNGRNERGDTRRALDAAKEGIEKLSGHRPVEPEAEQYRERLLEILTRQRSIIERHAEARQKNWAKAEDEQEALVEEYSRFLDEYDKWLPGYLNRHGLEIKKEA